MSRSRTVHLTLCQQEIKVHNSAEDKNLERRNVERSVLRNLKIANIKMTKDELFDGFIIDFFYFL